MCVALFLFFLALAIHASPKQARTLFEASVAADAIYIFWIALDFTAKRTSCFET